MSALKDLLIAWKRLTPEDRELFLLFFADTPATTQAPAVVAPVPVASRGPDPRGRYACAACKKVLPTKRGRSLHEAYCTADSHAGKTDEK